MGRPSRVHSAGKSPGLQDVHPECQSATGSSMEGDNEMDCSIDLWGEGHFFIVMPFLKAFGSLHSALHGGSNVFYKVLLIYFVKCIKGGNVGGIICGCLIITFLKGISLFLLFKGALQQFCTQRSVYSSREVLKTVL